MFEFDQLHTLTDREATPLLKHTMTQQQSFQALIDFALETFPPIHDAAINVVTVSCKHPPVGAVDGLHTHVK